MAATRCSCVVAAGGAVDMQMKTTNRDEQDISIIMRYTGWSRQTAINAIRQYKAYNPDWNADYVKMYLVQRKAGLTER